MKTYYSSAYTVPLPDGHRFPMEKYALIRNALPARAGLPEEWIQESPLITRSEVAMVHDATYHDAFVEGRLDRRHMRRIGFPWSAELVGRIQTTVGGTLAAARTALVEGLGTNLAGGTHHARRADGEGFCVFNDIAVAAANVLAMGEVSRVAVVDLDVHQGNGTAELIGGRDEVFLLSVHGEKNYPFVKVEADIDLGLPDHCGAERFLEAVAVVLPAAFEFEPDIVFYQAGVDVIATDTLGRLSLDASAVYDRDRLVFEAVRAAGVPLALVLGGGYADPIEDTVAAHVQTYRALNDVFCLW